MPPAKSKVAVIVRTRRRPVLLRRALASIAAQTLQDIQNTAYGSLVARLQPQGVGFDDFFRHS